MKISLEADHGSIQRNPTKVVDALVSVVSAEGGCVEHFLHDLAKAAGATKASGGSVRAEETPFQAVKDAQNEASRIYETAMTVAVNEILELLEDHLSSIDIGEFLKQAGV